MKNCSCCGRKEARLDSTVLKLQHYLSVVEAKYHHSFTCSYIQDLGKRCSQNEQNRKEQAGLDDAHKMAFSHVILVLQQKGIVVLKGLHRNYVTKLAGTPYTNLDYRGENL